MGAGDRAIDLLLHTPKWYGNGTVSVHKWYKNVANIKMRERQIS